MKVIEEQKNAIPRQSEIVSYEKGVETSIEDCYKRLNVWFMEIKSVIVGRGGNHVFVSRADTKERILLITES